MANFNLKKRLVVIKSLSLLLLYLGCAVFAYAQTHPAERGVEMSAGEDDYHAKLRLTTSIAEKLYCADGNLRLTLRLNFTNVGAEPVILDKRSSIIPYFNVSRSVKAAEERKYRIEAHLLIKIDGRFMSLEPVLDESHFVILKPGESYSLNSELGLPFYNGSEESKNSLRNGDYFLKVAVLTWYYPNASNIKWREQWRQKGYLRADPVSSIPMPFTIEKKPSVADCRL